MERKQFSSILDEAVGQLNNEVGVLKTQQQTITLNLKELERTRDKLSQDIFNLGEKKKELIKSTQEEITKMSATVKEKLSQATIKEGLVITKNLELEEKLKEAKDLIKSNENTQRNLEIQRQELKSKKDVLSNLISLAKETISRL